MAVYVVRVMLHIGASRGLAVSPIFLIVMEYRIEHINFEKLLLNQHQTVHFLYIQVLKLY